MLATIRARTHLWRYLARLMMYRGLYEPVTVRAMRRFLTAGDTFIDVGANVGYLSALGTTMVGTGGQVHCFEPVPAISPGCSGWRN